mgnify:CR=1 FL=1
MRGIGKYDSIASMPSKQEQSVIQEKQRLLLYINGVLAVRTIPLDAGERDLRIANWERIYYPNPRIEMESA